MGQSPYGLELVTFLTMVGHVKPLCLFVFIGTNTATKDISDFQCNVGHHTGPDDSDNHAYNLPLKIVLDVLSTSVRLNEEQTREQGTYDALSLIHI